MLWPSKGLKKSSLPISLEGGDVSTISMRPWPALPLPAHSYTAALAVCRAAVGPLHRGVELLIRSEEHTSELQSLRHLACRLLLEIRDLAVVTADAADNNYLYAHLTNHRYMS